MLKGGECSEVQGGMVVVMVLKETEETGDAPLLALALAE